MLHGVTILPPWSRTPMLSAELRCCRQNSDAVGRDNQRIAQLYEYIRAPVGCSGGNAPVSFTDRFVPPVHTHLLNILVKNCTGGIEIFEMID